MTRYKNYIVTTKYYDFVTHKWKCREYWFDGTSEVHVREQAEQMLMLDDIISIEQTDRDTAEDYDYE